MINYIRDLGLCFRKRTGKDAASEELNPLDIKDIAVGRDRKCLSP